MFNDSTTPRAAEVHCDVVKKAIIKYTIIIISTVLTVAAFINVFGDNTEVIARAELAMCGTNPKCKFAKSKLVRTPFSQTLTFVGEGKSIDVVCRRSWIWFGTYHCKVQR